MYLRRNRSPQGYEYWTLVRSVRTAQGPRQQLVATLGKLPGLDAKVRVGWEDVDALLEGRTPARQLSFEEPVAQEEALWREVDVRGVRVERVREFGAVYLGLALWRRLRLHQVLDAWMGWGKEAVGWERVACILAVARFCAQPSELGVAERWYAKSALEDLLGVSGERVNDDRLYRGLDALGKRKDQLTAHLLERYRSWLGVRFEFLVYDVTSTYFEGQGGGAKAARGHSRDHRPDCKQVCIGLVVTPEGLPLAFEVFAGNRNDVTTVQEIVRVMEEKYGCAERIWVMDRGMVSEENIEWLRSRSAYYVVGTPKSELKRFERELLDREGWQAVRPDVEVKLVDPPDGRGREQYILCRSAARREKEKAMLARQQERLGQRLRELDEALRRRAQSSEVAATRLGRWLGRYPAAERLLEVQILKNAQGLACGLEMRARADRAQWAAHAQGAYLLRTNSLEKDPTRLWQWYLQLQEAEAMFRLGKSDLRLRPIFHRKTERVDAHILVCFLALAMWRVLEMWMKGKGLGTCARQLVAEVGSIKSMDVVLPVRTAQGTTELRLRVVSKPDRMVAELLQRLGLQLPEQSRIVGNVVEKIGV